ncbi:IctB family putative bicarbonate transporter [Coleofasciculus sp. FACHB-1120]|uniref:IctB family putative bicarbonate transporter n=1 Tax=Coleofasciculus sp. FACHB-1120 TaxID=2692783 RepID=UPI00168439A2|nr:IctB family putative bicarbonate transporter [Coleofasciculus sp. FACHB-1120]MBD2743421.1 putative bicarbonate transporter, IctB family [Coleofasciculus sp. FACHB-1120]
MTVWQQFTLSSLPLYQWQSASYLHRLVGSLRSWRQSSFCVQWAEPLGALLVALVFALAPFVSTALVGVLLAACAGFWILLTLSDEAGYVPGEASKVTPIHWLVLLYWGISTVATALSPVKMAALKGWGKLTLYLLFFALMARVLRSPRLRSILIAVYLHIALIVSVYGLRQWFFGAEALATWTDPTSPMSKTTRVYSYLGNPNLLAAYLLPAIALSLAAIFAWRGWSRKALALTMFAVNSACLILTFSRGGWIGFILLLFVFSLMLLYWISEHLPPFWRTWSLPILLGSLALVLAVAILFVEPVRDRAFSIFANRSQDSSNNFRVNVWEAVVEMIRDRPILGIGPGNEAFNKIYPLYQRPRYTALSAYSVFLELAVETGLIGFCCFMWLLVVTFNQGWLQLNRLRQLGRREGFWLIAAIATIFGLLGHGLVDTVWYRPEVNTLWWMMVALIASYYTFSPGSDRTPQTITEHS